MMKKRMGMAAIALSTVGLVQPSFAADKYFIDPEHVSVNFSMQHMKWAKYQGTIRNIEGVIVFDRENVAASSVHVEIAATGIDTLDKNRDFELQSAVGGFLNAEEFPKLTFDGTRIEKTGDNTGNIVGDLAMAGVTKPVILNVIFDGEGKSDWDGKMRVGFSATGAINTNDFGLTGLSRLDIGPQLDFTIEVEATKW